MIDLLSKIQNSIPTLKGVEAQQAIADVFSSAKWVIVSSEIIGYAQAEIFSNAYLATAATIEVHGQSLLTMQPLHIAYLAENELEFESSWSSLWLLIYSNGAVCLAERKDQKDPYLTIFVTKDVADLFEIDYTDLQ